MMDAFEAICDELGFAGFNNKRRRNLFKCLDADADGCITENDLKFLVHFKDDDAPPSAKSSKSIKGKGRGNLSARKRAEPLVSGGAGGAGKGNREGRGFQALSPDGAPFVFEVVVNREEYKEYLERKRLHEAQQRHSQVGQRNSRRSSISQQPEYSQHNGTAYPTISEQKTSYGRARSDSEDSGVPMSSGAWDISSVYAPTFADESSETMGKGLCPLSEILPFTWDEQKPSGASPRAMIGAQASAIGAMRAHMASASPSVSGASKSFAKGSDRGDQTPNSLRS